MGDKAKTIMPALPRERYGWGRLVRILRDYSTAPLEIKLGLGSIARGLWQWQASMDPWEHHYVHPFTWQGTIPLWAWGIIVAVLGAMQLVGVLWRFERMRTTAASCLAGSLVYITLIYMLHAPSDIATVLYGTIMLGEMWIALRGWPVLGGKPLNGNVADDN
jgi:hypothetical protein